MRLSCSHESIARVVPSLPILGESHQKIIGYDDLGRTSDQIQATLGDRREKGEIQDDDPEVASGRKSCEDGHKECPAWAQAGQCTQNAAFMLPACRDSCGDCLYSENAPMKARAKVSLSPVLISGKPPH